MRKRGTLALVALVVGLGTTLVFDPPPLLIWNPSASAPVGFYAVLPSARLKRGDYALAWPPEATRELAARRHYLPRNVPLVKRVAALGGDRICARGRWILVGQRTVARRRAADVHGRPLPAWQGCRTLADGEVLLLMPHPDSFDGRYFGATQRAQVIGKAVPLWVR